MATHEQNELISLHSQISVIDQELEAAYTQIGRRYVEHIAESGEMTAIDITDMLVLIDPKLTRKQELQKKIIELEKEINQRNILRERAFAEEQYEQEKLKLDKALAMELLTEEEHRERLAAARRRLDNFEAIRKIQLQSDMGLISKEEKKARLELLNAEPEETALEVS